LRRCFEVDAESIVVGTLFALAEKGQVERSTVAKAIADPGIDPEKKFPEIV
jgi:pyruvate dehydrogenase E1 component